MREHYFLEVGGLTWTWLDKLEHEGADVLMLLKNRSILGTLIKLSQEVEKIMALVTIDQAEIDQFTGQVQQFAQTLEANAQAFVTAAQTIATELNTLLTEVANQGVTPPAATVTNLQTALNAASQAGTDIGTALEGIQALENPTPVTPTPPTPPTPTPTPSPSPTTSAPSVTAIQPATGTVNGGDAVTVAGSGFTGATGVNLVDSSGNATAAASFVVQDDATVVITTPALPAATYDIEVVGADGTSSASSADQFTTS